jgi:glycosyltransferase involved in cell wall biosynthesis
MKVLHLSTSDVDNGGARAAHRLHRGLERLGTNSQMLVRAKFGHDRTVVAEKSLLTKLGPPSESLPLRLYPDRDAAMFSTQWLPDVLASRAKEIDPDIINLHWVCNGYLQIETLPKLDRPLVWTLHDLWPFTGGCTYPQTCDRFQANCGDCPQLHSGKSADLSRWIWQRKAKAWAQLDLTIVATSHWMADCARASSLFRDLRIETIPLGLDLDIYQPIDKQFARQVLHLPPDKQLVLFGAINPTSDPRKGFQLLLPALQQLSQSGWQDRIELVVFGADLPAQPIDLSFKTHYLGCFHDDLALALVYAAADVTIVPSTQEAFGQTASESLACGTPVVAFETTGLQDIVDRHLNGYLAKPFDIKDLAHGIEWVLADPPRYQKLQFHAREKAVQQFAAEVQARRYLSLYEEILGGFRLDGI